MDEGFLDGIFSPVTIAADERRDREEAVSSGHRESLEGFVIAAPRRFDDIALHRLLRRLRYRLVALSPYDGLQDVIVQESS
jgi:hypothetical protein